MVKGCIVPGCQKQPVTREWCGAHYQSGLASGEIERLKPYAGLTCMVDGCERKRKGKGRRCVAHAYRWAAWGDVRSDLPVKERDGTRPIVGHPLFKTWDGIKSRTSRPGNRSYSYYGGRGISMHPEWLMSPAAFFEWIEANLGDRPDGHTLDRIDNDGNYEPGNLRWATPQEQQANTRRRKSA